MNNLIAKFKKKEFVQDMLVEAVGDVIMIALGIIAGYYVKVYIIG